MLIKLCTILFSLMTITFEQGIMFPAQMEPMFPISPIQDLPGKPYGSPGGSFGLFPPPEKSLLSPFPVPGYGGPIRGPIRPLQSNGPFAGQNNLERSPLFNLPPPPAMTPKDPLSYMSPSSPIGMKMDGLGINSPLDPYQQGSSFYQPSQTQQYGYRRRRRRQNSGFPNMQMMMMMKIMNPEFAENGMMKRDLCLHCRRQRNIICMLLFCTGEA